MEEPVSGFVSATSRLFGIALASAMVLTLTSSPAMAQAADPNPGAITLTTGVDFPSVYFFRGIRQEADPKITLFPYGDVGIAMGRATVNFGVWNSLHTGSSGADGFPGQIHYEEDFYASLTVGVGGVNVTPMFTAYTSPNGLFDTVKELSFKVSHASRYAPYGLVAFELGGELSGQADGGHLDVGEKGVYAEFGVAPNWPLSGGAATVAVPVKLGLSLKDYYELGGDDHKFGYVDVGVLFTLPLTGISSNFGSWNIHGGANFLGLGDTTKAFNQGDGGQVIVSAGIGLSY
jgi:hypothetical protein